LVACNSVLIPIQCEFYALEGVSQLLNTINLIRDNLNPTLEIEGVVLTMADFRTNLTHEVIEEINGYFSNKVYSSIIPRNVKLSEAPSFGKPIMLYDPNCLGSEKYKELSIELIGPEKYAELVGEDFSKKTQVNNQRISVTGGDAENNPDVISNEKISNVNENNFDAETTVDAWPTVNEVESTTDEAQIELNEEWSWMTEDPNIKRREKEKLNDFE